MKRQKIQRIAIILLMLFCVAMQTAVLTACARDKQEVEKEQEILILDGNEEQTSDEGGNPHDNTGEGNDTDAAGSDAKSLILTQQEAEEFLEPLTQWAGLYMIGAAEQWKSYDDTLKRQIAGITIAYGMLPEIAEGSRSALEVNGVWAADLDCYLYVTSEEIQAAAEYLFGEPIQSIPAMDDPQNAEGLCLNDGDGGMLVRAGDWGISIPKFEILSIENIDDTINRVTAAYYMYDLEEEEYTQDLGRVIYQIQNGPSLRITHMEIQSYYEDPDAYLLENWEKNAVILEFEDYTLKIPAEWEGRFHTYRDAASDIFVCTAAAGENYTGFLFSIAAMPHGTESDLPAYTIVGYKGNTDFVAVYPTDVEFDPDDDAAAREYTNLNQYVDAILSTFEVKE